MTSPEGTTSARVTAVHRGLRHSVTKDPQPEIRLLAGLGVEGDVHAGPTVQHRSRWRHADRPNLRQVHLLHAELHGELRAAGYDLAPGQMGENVTTAGVDLLGLPTGARLLLGDAAVVQVTGLRNPCRQLDDLQPGLMAAVLGTDDLGHLVRKAGVMAVVVAGGTVRAGDRIGVELPAGPPVPLAPV